MLRIKEEILEQASGLKARRGESASYMVKLLVDFFFKVL